MAELTTLARPYAKAVFAEASEKNALDAWSDDLSVLAAFAADADMAKLIKHPALTSTQQADALIDVCGDSSNAEVTTTSTVFCSCAFSSS